MEGLRAIDRAALTIQDTAFMRLYFDAPEYHDRFRQELLDRVYGMLEAAPEMTAEASREHKMLAQAAQLAEAGDLAAPERFTLIETEGGYAVWDDIRAEIYVDPEGVSEEFTSEWQAEDYLAQVRKEAAERDAADWLAVERAKLPPLEYAIGDWFTVYSEGAAKEIVLTNITDDDVFYVYADEPGQDRVFMDRGMFEHGLRSGQIRDAQPKEAVQTVASYRNGEEAIVIQQYPNGQFYNHYGFNEQSRFAVATAGGFASFEEAEAALRSHRPQAERVMEGPEEVHAEPVPGTEPGQMPESETPETPEGVTAPPVPETGSESVTELEEEPRFSIIMTSDAFPDPEDAFAIWDSSVDDYYTVKNGVFEDVVTFPDEEAAQAYLEQLEEKYAERPAPKGPAYQVGDTVYLDDTAFIVEEIGLFDVQLRDPALAYPVFRSESKERLESLLRRDDRNAKYLPDDKSVEEENPFADVDKWAADYQSQTETAIAALEPDQRRIVDAMQTAGFFYDPLAATTPDPIIFRSGELLGGYPLSLKTWDEAYAFIDEIGRAHV